MVFKIRTIYAVFGSKTKCTIYKFKRVVYPSSLYQLQTMAIYTRAMVLGSPQKYIHKHPSEFSINLYYYMRRCCRRRHTPYPTYICEFNSAAIGKYTRTIPKRLMSAYGRKYTQRGPGVQILHGRAAQCQVNVRINALDKFTRTQGGAIANEDSNMCTYVYTWWVAFGWCGCTMYICTHTHIWMVSLHILNSIPYVYCARAFKRVSDQMNLL